MPARDLFHDQVKHALIKDGWTITDDPLHIKWRKKNLYVDLGAERLLAAEKAERRIAVEIKSFVGRSDIADLEAALGQFVLSDAAGEDESRTDALLGGSRDRLRECFQEVARRVAHRRGPLAADDL